MNNFALRCAMFLLLGLPSARASVTVLVTDTAESAAYLNTQRAAQLTADPRTNEPPVVATVDGAFAHDVAHWLAAQPPEKVWSIARRRFPHDDVLLVTATIANADITTLRAALQSFLDLPLAERQAVLRQTQGVLAITTSRFSTTAPNKAAPRAAADPQAVKFTVDSDECATFARNNVTFDNPCGYGPGRGINIVVINENTAEIDSIYTFDTYIDTPQAAAYLQQYLPQIPASRIVLLAIADANELTQVPAAVTAMQQRFGSACIAKIDFRDTWAGISQNMKVLAEQCNAYAKTGDYVDSTVSTTLQTLTSADLTPPAGTFLINNGASMTSSNLVTLDFSAMTDNGSGLSSGAKIRVSNNNKDWSPMLEYARSIHWALPRGNGKKTVYAQVRDVAGNWTDTLTATIDLEEQVTLRQGPVGSGSYYESQFCLSQGTLVALGDDGTVATSTDLGSDWSKASTILPSKSDYGWNRLTLNCDQAGNIIAAGFTLDKGTLSLVTNTSSNAGQTWKASPATASITIPTADYYYPQWSCASPPSNIAIFWTASTGNAQQLYAVASPDGGTTWPTAPVQMTNLGANSSIGDAEFSCNGATIVAAVAQSNQVTMYRSINGGGAFTSGTPAASGVQEFGLIADPKGNLLLLSTVYANDYTYNLVARRSTDNGTTWTLPAAVGSGVMGYQGFQAVSPAPGLFYIAWTTQTATDGSQGIRVVSSKDGGVTWSSPTTIATTNYFYTFMLAEKPYIDSFSLAANATGGVEVLWADTRQGLIDGYTVQRRGVADAARGPHEDQTIRNITDLYVGTSTNYAAAFTLTGPIESNPTTGESYPSAVAALLSPNGIGIGTWNGNTTLLDLRFLNGITTPLVDPGGPVNDASKHAGPLATGEVAAVTGQNLAMTPGASQPPALATNLGGTSGTITDTTGSTVSVALYSVSGNQIRFVVPETLATGAATLRIAGGAGTITTPITITAIAPGLYSTTADGNGTPAGWITQGFADTTSAIVTLSPTTPITITPSTVFSQIALMATGVHHAKTVKIIVGGATATSVSVYADPNWPGLDEVSGYLPASLAGAGTVPVYLMADGVTSNTLSLTFK